MIHIFPSEIGFKVHYDLSEDIWDFRAALAVLDRKNNAFIAKMACTIVAVFYRFLRDWFCTKTIAFYTHYGRVVAISTKAFSQNDAPIQCISDNCKYTNRCSSEYPLGHNAMQ